MRNSTVQTHLDCLIHLGAGRCSELDDHLEREPGRLVLVEADKGLADSLRQRVAGQSNVQVVNAAIAAETGQRTYFRFNLPAVNSLRQPTGLRALYPGLRVLEEQPVRALGVTEFLDSLDLAPDESNGLVMELAGEDLAVLEALEVGDKLHHFCEVELVAGRESLYEGSKPAHLILQWLESNGYEVRGEDAAYDRERPRWRLRRNDLVLKVRALRERVEQLASRASHVDKIEKLAEDRLAALEAAEGAIEAHRADIKKLQAALALATKERDKQSKSVQERAQQIQELTRSRDELKQKADDLSRRLNSLEAERTDTHVRQELLNQEMTRAEAQIDLIKDVLLRDVGL
jgi:hypothetical protein